MCHVLPLWGVAPLFLLPVRGWSESLAPAPKVTVPFPETGARSREETGHDVPLQGGRSHTQESDPKGDPEPALHAGAARAVARHMHPWGTSMLSLGPWTMAEERLG